MSQAEGLAPDPVGQASRLPGEQAGGTPAPPAGGTPAPPAGGAPAGGAGDPPAGSQLQALRKYVNIFRVSLIERLAYRGDFFLATFLRFLPMVTTILLWEAIFAGAGKDTVAGFTRKQMIAYLLLVHVSR